MSTTALITPAPASTTKVAMAQLRVYRSLVAFSVIFTLLQAAVGFTLIVALEPDQVTSYQVPETIAFFWVVAMFVVGIVVVSTQMPLGLRGGASRAVQTQAAGIADLVMTIVAMILWAIFLPIARSMSEARLVITGVKPEFVPSFHMATQVLPLVLTLLVASAAGKIIGAAFRDLPVILGIIICLPAAAVPIASSAWCISAGLDGDIMGLFGVSVWPVVLAIVITLALGTWAMSRGPIRKVG